MYKLFKLQYQKFFVKYLDKCEKGRVNITFKLEFR
jgi:hypothetical protein